MEDFKITDVLLELENDASWEADEQKRKEYINMLKGILITF